MPDPHPDRCHCHLCRYEAAHEEKDYHRELTAFLSTLNREQRRLYAAVESNRLGRGGVAKVSKIMGLCEQTIAHGRRDLERLVQGQSPPKVRKPIKGRPRTEEKDPSITATLEELLRDEVAGNPDGGEKWVRSSTRRLAERLEERGLSVSHNTVWRLLDRMGFSMKTHVRNRRGVTRDPKQRDDQFLYMKKPRATFLQAGWPVISVDTKKKELIGNFRNKGRSWCREAMEVNEYDFPSLAECLAVPYGIYDLKRNTGYVVVGMSHNTPEFAVSSICKWWEEDGRSVYDGANQLLIFADGGGGNGSRSRAWKWNLKEMLCNRFGLTVTVCHYPPGCSKWNPVEYRLFSEISKNWEGKPLRTLRIMLGYIRGTTTATGLSVKAVLDEGIYAKGQKVTQQDVDKLDIRHHEVCWDWNYTISPSGGGLSATPIPNSS
jgi:transposase